MVSEEHKFLVINIKADDALWNTPGGLDLQPLIVEKYAEKDLKWEKDEKFYFDCYSWGDGWLEIAGGKEKYCQNVEGLDYTVTVKAPPPPGPPYHGTNTGKPFYKDIREQELKCLADRNSEWHYDAATNTGTCTKKSLTPYKPYEPEHDIRAQKQAKVVQKALNK